MYFKNVRAAALMLAASWSAATASPTESPLQDNFETSSSELLKVTGLVRMDFQRNYTDWDVNKENSGFEGKYFLLKVEGNVLPQLSYHWRQRINRGSKDTNFFDSTDWLYIDYSYRNLTFSAGKEVVAIGGWEYDRAPIDLYSCSQFWNGISCFQFAASVTYNFTGTNALKAQMSESPFFSDRNRDLYSYNLMWTGKNGIFESLWSANMVEYADSRYISYISLGNKFNFSEKWILEADFMNRAASHQKFLFRDCSVIAELRFKPVDKLVIYGKYTYDVNRTGTDADYIVLSGTEQNMAGAGLEYYPLKKKNTSLRLHLNGFYSWGSNTNPDAVMQNKSAMFDCGVTWVMDFFSLKRK